MMYSVMSVSILWGLLCFIVHEQDISILLGCARWSVLPRSSCQDVKTPHRLSKLHRLTTYIRPKDTQGNKNAQNDDLSSKCLPKVLPRHSLLLLVSYCTEQVHEQITPGSVTSNNQHRWIILIPNNILHNEVLSASFTKEELSSYKCGYWTAHWLGYNCKACSLAWCRDINHSRMYKTNLRSQCQWLGNFGWRWNNNEMLCLANTHECLAWQWCNICNRYSHYYIPKRTFCWLYSPRSHWTWCSRSYFDATC